MATDKYWIVMEYVFPKEGNARETVAPILHRYAELGRETGAEDFTVHTDREELERAWQAVRDAN